MRHKGLNHVALRVNDVDRSVRFYQQLFSMRVFGNLPVNARSVPLVSLNMSAQVTLVGVDGPTELDTPSGTPGQIGGIDHFGFNVPPSADFDKIQREVELLGGRFVQRVSIGPNVPSLFVHDPDGYLIQITRFPRFANAYVVYLFLRQFVLNLRKQN